MSKRQLYTTIAMAVAGFAVAYTVGRRTIRSRCLVTVKKQCSSVPLFTDQFCTDQAVSICKV